MKRIGILIIAALVAAGCSQTYKAQPMPFKAPAAYPNAQQVAGTVVAAQAFSDKTEASKAFGFDVRGAGMLPVQVIFDNQGSHRLEIRPEQTFLEDDTGNLWPILSRDMAYERATRYVQTEEVFKEGAYHGFLGAAAGTVIGAAVGIVTGEDMGQSIGRGAAVGAAAGATLGGLSGYSSGEARRKITGDLRSKSLENQEIAPGSLAHGFLFFPGEAKSAKALRLQLQEKDTEKIHVVLIPFPG